MKRIYYSIGLALSMLGFANAQLLMNNGALIQVQANAGVYVVGGDVRVTTNGANTGSVVNNGFVEIRGGSLTVDGLLTNYQNIDTTNVDGGSLTVATTSILALGPGSGMRVTDDVTLAVGTMGADATSKFHFDGDHHSTAAAVQVVSTGVAAGDIDAATPPVPWPNAFGDVRLNTPGLDMTAANSHLLVQGSLDFNDGPSWNYATSTGGAAATNTAIATDNKNIITLAAANRLVMGPGADFNGVETGTLSIIDQDGVATPTDVQTREFAVGGEIQWFTSAAQTTYMFPIGGDMGSGNTIQHMQVVTSGDPTGDFDKLRVTFDPAMKAAIPVVHCMDPTNANSATQWTGTWNFDAYNAAVQETGPTTVTYNISLRPVDCAPDVGGTSGTVVLHTGDATPDAVDILNCNASAYNLTVSANMNAFSEGMGYTVPVTPLPVEDLAIRATPMGDYIRVDWSTQREVNASHYDLQRSLDGTNFTTIVPNVSANGTTNSPSYYGNNDMDVVFNQPYYYRVKQYDFDGSMQPSQVVQAILTKGSTDFSARFFPNPATNSLLLNITATEDRTVSFRMYDNIGKLVYTGSVEAKAGVNTFDMQPVLEKLSSGTYAVMIQSGNEVIQERLIRMDN